MSSLIGFRDYPQEVLGLITRFQPKHSSLSCSSLKLRAARWKWAEKAQEPTAVQSETVRLDYSVFCTSVADTDSDVWPFLWQSLNNAYYPLSKVSLGKVFCFNSLWIQKKKKQPHFDALHWANASRDAPRAEPGFSTTASLWDIVYSSSFNMQRRNISEPRVKQPQWSDRPTSESW